MAMTITGRVEIFVNGQLLLSKTGATASGIGVSGRPAFERTAVLGDSGLHGFTETPTESRLDVTVTDRDDAILSDFNAIDRDGTIIFRSPRGGKTYTLNDAFSLGIASLTSGEGEVTLSFIGSSWSERVE